MQYKPRLPLAQNTLFLSRILPESEQIILLAKDSEKIVGFLAGFVHTGRDGAVLNSLPYFGGHGDILLTDETVDKHGIVFAIVSRLESLCKERSVGAMNIVSHPLHPQIESCATSVESDAMGFEDRANFGSAKRL